MASIDELFPLLAEVVRRDAGSRGFTETAERMDEAAFGGRVLRWRRGAEELRLIWDGREQWLNFEYRPAPDYPPALEWTGTLSERYTGQNISDTDATRLREGLAGAAGSVWSRRPERI